MKKLEMIKSELVLEKLGLSKGKKAQTDLLLVDMVLNSGLEKIGIEKTSNGGFNRGSLGECCLRAVILQYLGLDIENISKSLSDLDINLTKRNKDLLNELGLKNQAYEIKTLTSLARASKLERLDLKEILLVDTRAKTKGVYLVNVKDLDLYQNCEPCDNAYNSIKGYKKAERLELLSELLMD